MDHSGECHPNMNNQLAERKVFLDFTPAELNMTNFDELKAEVEKYASKYHGLTFDADEKKEAEAARSKLLSLHKALEDERKTVKRVYNQPLNEFEEKVKELTSIINVPLNDIREGLKEIEEAQKEARSEALNEYLGERAKDNGLSLNDIEQDDRWLNKGNWTDKLKPTAKLTEEIDFVIESTLKEKKRKESEIKILETFCKSLSVDSAGWVTQLEHRSATEVMDLINMDIERKKRVAEQQEAKRKQYEEYQKQQEEAIVEAREYAEPEPVVKEEPQLSSVIRVTATQSKLTLLNEFLVAHKIRVEEVNLNNQLSEDDLPW